MTISRARTTGAVYLLYFVVVIGAAASIGRTPSALSDAANLVANAGYIVVTLLLPAVQSGEPQSGFICRGDQRGGLRDSIAELVSSRSRAKRPADFRGVQPHHRYPHFKVDLPAARSGRLDGPLGSGLANVSVARVARVSKHVRRDSRHRG